MASSAKRASASLQHLTDRLHGKRVAVALSGGMDSVVLLHLLKDRPGVSAVHVHHGLSPNADAWSAFCRRLCKRWHVPLTVRRVKVKKTGKGLEAAAREARYAVFKTLKADCIALAHHLDDQAETVLFNLLRGAGLRGASGMREQSRLDGKLLVRPLLDVPRDELLRYAKLHGLEWIEDESNADEALTRNFIRRRLAPLIAERFPRWNQSLARAARHFAEKEDRRSRLLREFLRAQGLRAPSEAKLAEMLKQLSSASARTKIEHDGRTLRLYRGKITVEAQKPAGAFAPRQWQGERRLPIPELGGELRFLRARGSGVDLDRVRHGSCVVRLRTGGERMQLDARRPRRTLKNLFQEAGVPPHERERLPLLCCGNDVVWAPGLGVDVRYRAHRAGPGVLPEWRLT